MVHLTVFYHATSMFYSEFTLCSYLNAKELLAQNRRIIWSLSNWNRIVIHNHLLRNWTLNHFKSMKVCFLESICVNFKNLIVWNGHSIWKLKYCNRIWTHNHLVCKLDTQAVTVCRFTLKSICDIIRAHSQMTIQISTHITAQSFDQFG